MTKSSFSKNSKRSMKLSNYRSSRISKIEKVDKTLLQKALKTGRGVSAHLLVNFLALNIITHNTTIEVTLTLLLPKEIANIMITVLRNWNDYKIYSERVLLDKVIIPITYNLKNNIMFILPKLKFSYIESCIILLGKLLIVIAILKHKPKSYIIKLRKDLNI